MILFIYPIEFIGLELFLYQSVSKSTFKSVIHVETYGQYPGKWTAFWVIITLRNKIKKKVMIAKPTKREAFHKTTSLQRGDDTIFFIRYWLCFSLAISSSYFPTLIGLNSTRIVWKLLSRTLLHFAFEKILISSLISSLLVTCYPALPK